MGMFERLGEKVERFKQEAVNARDESAEFRCRNCGTEIYHERDACPECGSDEIARVATGASSDAEPDPKPKTDGEPETDAAADAEPETDGE